MDFYNLQIDLIQHIEHFKKKNNRNLKIILFSTCTWYVPYHYINDNINPPKL